MQDVRVVLLALTGSVLVGCLNTEGLCAPPPGELSRFEFDDWCSGGVFGGGCNTSNPYAAGNSVFANGDSDFFEIDLTDPRHPDDTHSRSSTSLSCGSGFCPGDVSDSIGLLLDSDELASVPLAYGAAPAWRFTMNPDPQRLNLSLVRLTTGHVAVGSKESGGGYAGYLTVVKVTNGEPSVVFEMPDDITSEHMTRSGERLFTLDEVVSANQHAIRVFDVSVPSLPVEVARPTFDLPYHFRTSSIAVRNHELFTLSFGPSPFASFDWYRFSDGWATLTHVGTYDKRAPHPEPVVVPLDGFVIFGVRGTEADPWAPRYSTLVLRLDGARPTVASDIPCGGSGKLAVDETRGLAYTGGGEYGLQVLDLGTITSGVPRWPETE